MCVSQEGIDDPEPTVYSCQMPRCTQPTGSRPGAHTKSPSAAFSLARGRALQQRALQMAAPSAARRCLASFGSWQSVMVPFSTAALMLTHLTGKVCCGLCPSCLRLEDRFDWNILMAFQHGSTVKTGEKFSFSHTAVSLAPAIPQAPSLASQEDVLFSPSWASPTDWVFCWEVGSMQ